MLYKTRKCFKNKTFYELLRPFQLVHPEKLEETLKNEQLNIYSIPKSSEISIFSRNFGDGLDTEKMSNQLLFHGSMIRKKRKCFFREQSGYNNHFSTT